MDDLTGATCALDLIMAKFRVALCQMASVDGDVSANDARARGFVKEAAEQGADLIVLPEFFIHVASTAAVPRLTEQTTRVADDPELASDGETARRNFSELAKEHKIAIVGGIVEHESGTSPRDGNLYNVCYYFRADGEMLCRCASLQRTHLIAQT